MSVVVTERDDSREYDLNAKDGSATWRFRVQTIAESDPEQAVYDALMNTTTYAPYQWKGLLRGRPKTKAMGGGWFTVEIPYVQAFGQQTSDPGATTPPGGQPPQPPPPSPAPTDLINNGVQIDVGGKPPRIYRSRQTITRQNPPSDKPAPNFDRYILVGPDGKSEGLEIPDPAVVLTLTLTFTYLTWGYIDRLKDTCWKTNDKPFAGRKVGELLLTGATGHVEKSGLVPMTFKFGVDKRELIPFGATENGAPLEADRGPWQFCWFAYGPGKDTNAPTGQPVGVELRGVYVEEIFDKADYKQLGIFA